MPKLDRSGYLSLAAVSIAVAQSIWSIGSWQGAAEEKILANQRTCLNALEEIKRLKDENALVRARKKVLENAK